MMDSMESLDRDQVRSIGRCIRRKASADTEKPDKRPLSPYIKFYKKQFPKVKKENPDLPVSEIAKIIGAEWRERTKRGRGRAGWARGREFVSAAPPRRERCRDQSL